METLDQFAARNPQTDPLELLQNYSDYTKTELLKTGAWDDEVVAEVDNRLAGIATEQGIDLGEDPISAFTKRKDDDTHLVQRYAKDPEAQRMARELAAVKSDRVRAAYEDSGADYLGKVSEMEAAYASNVPLDARNEARREALRTGDLPFAKISTPDGDHVEFGPGMSDIRDDAALAAAFDANPNLDRSLIGAVKARMNTPEGFDVPAYKLDRQADFAGAFQTVLGKDKNIAGKLSQMVGALDKERDPGWVSAALDRKGSNLDPLIDQISTDLSAYGFGDDFTADEKKAFIRDYATSLSAPNVDEKNVDANVSKLSSGQVHLPLGVMLNKTLFDKTLAESKVIPEAQKQALKDSRDDRVKAYAKDAFAVITKSRPEFTGFYDKAKEAGATDADVLDKWMSNPDNYSEFRTQAMGTVDSVADALGGLVLAPFVLAGSEGAREALQTLQDRDTDRRAYARLFGRNLGAGYDMQRLIAPVAVDIGAGVFSGSLAEPLIAAKWGVKAALKNAMRTALTTETRSALKAFTEFSAGRALAREVGEGGLATTGREALSGLQAAGGGVDKVIGLAGQDIAQSLRKTASTAGFLVPQFNRSAGSTYVQLHSTLSNQKNADGTPRYTPQQVREIALPHAVLAGTITAATSAAFQFLGKGGAEALFDGMTHKQGRAIYDRMVQSWSKLAPEIKQGIDARTYETFMASLQRKAAAPLLGKLAAHGADEAMEEMGDQFLNYINQHVAESKGDPNLKYNPVEHLKETLYAGMLGFGMGAGANVATNAMSKAPDANLENAVRRNTLLETATKLQNAKSPATAAVFRRMALQGITETAPPATQESVPAGDAGKGTVTPPGDAGVAQAGAASAQAAGAVGVEPEALVAMRQERETLAASLPELATPVEGESEGQKARRVKRHAEAKARVAQLDKNIKTYDAGTIPMGTTPEGRSPKGPQTTNVLPDGETPIEVGDVVGQTSDSGGTEVITTLLPEAPPPGVGGEVVPEVAEPESVVSDTPLIREITVNTSEGQQVRFEVQSNENRDRVARGEREIGGNALFKTMEEANTYIVQEAKRDSANKVFAAEQEAAAAKEAATQMENDAPLVAYVGSMEGTAMQKGKVKASLKEQAARRDSATGKVYQGERHAVVREMIRDGWKPSKIEVPKLKDKSSREWNRMDNQQQRAWEKRMVEAGTKTEYVLETEDGRNFAVTKAEHDYAVWLGLNPPQTQSPAESKGKKILSERAIRARMEDGDPVPVADADTYGIQLPEGYVKQGDLYVYQPGETTIPTGDILYTPKPDDTVTPDEAKSIASVIKDPASIRQHRAAVDKWLSAHGIVTEGLPDAHAAVLIQSARGDRTVAAQGGFGQSAETGEQSTVRADLEALGINKGVPTFLANVAKGKDQYAKIARLLLSHPKALEGLNVTLTQLPDATLHGFFVPSTGQVLVNTTKAGPRGAVDTVLHELYHAVTEYSIQNPSVEQSIIIKRLESIRRSVAKKATTDADIYASSSIQEFATHIATDPDFQQRVDAMTPKKSKSWLRQIIETIADLLNAGVPKKNQLDYDTADLVMRLLDTSAADVSAIRSAVAAAGEVRGQQTQTYEQQGEAGVLDTRLSDSERPSDSLQEDRSPDNRPPLQPTPESVRAYVEAIRPGTVLDHTQLAKDIEGLSPVMAEDMVHSQIHLATARDAGLAAAGEVRMQRSTEAAEEEFTNEVKKYVTGNWPSDAAGRYEELRKFTEQWSKRYSALLELPEVTFRIEMGVLGSGESTRSSAAAMESDGRVLVQIGGSQDAKIAERGINEESAKIAKARIIQEEVFHAAQLIAVRDQIKGKNPSDYTSATVRYLVDKFDAMLSGLGGAEQQNRVVRGVLSTMGTYFGRKISDQEFDTTSSSDIVNTLDEKGRGALLAETVRQIVQLRRSGGITESSFVRALKPIEDWRQSLEDTLREISIDPASLGMDFESEVDGTERVLNNAGIRFQRSDTLTEAFDRTVQGNLTTSDIATFRSEPETREKFGRFLKASAASLWSDLTQRFDPATAVHHDRTVAMARDVADNFAIRSLTRGFTTGGEVRMQYAGERANMPAFRRDSLETAKTMAASGKDSEEIRAITGWFPGVDGKMRWEIPDEGAKVRPLVGVIGTDGVQSLREGETARTTLGELLDHPALFEAYPELANTPVVLDPRLDSYGRYNLSGGTISIRQSDAFVSDARLSTLLHEVQHAIQLKEGHPYGTDMQSAVWEASDEQIEAMRGEVVKTFNTEVEQRVLAHRREILNNIRVADKPSLDAALASKDTPKVKDIIGVTDGSFDLEIRLSQSANRLLEMVTNMDTDLQVRLNKQRESKKVADSGTTEELRMLFLDYPHFAEKLYLANPGEVEARDVQARQNYTEEQRAAIAPYASQNIAPEDQIIRFQRSFDNPTEGSYEHTRYMLMQDGNQLFSTTDEDVETEAKTGLLPTLRRLFATRDDLPRAWSQQKTGHEFLHNTTQQKIKQLERMHKTASLKENAPTTIIGTALGNTAPLLTEEMEAKVNEDMARRDDNIRETFATRLEDTRDRHASEMGKAIRAKERVQKDRLRVKRSGIPEDIAASDAAFAAVRERVKQLSDSHEAEILAVQNAKADAFRESYEQGRRESLAAQAAEAGKRRTERDKALQELRGNYPLTYEWVGKYREMIDELQDHLVKWYGISNPGLAGIIDASRGVYLARTYNFFNDPAMAEMVLNNPEYAKVREDAITFLQTELIKDEVVALRKDPAMANTVEDDLVNIATERTADLAKQMFYDYVKGHETGFTAIGSSASDIRTMFQRFMRKRNIDESLRAVLGEELDPFTNATRTYASLSSILLSQKLLTGIHDDGIASGKIITEAQAKADPKYEKWVPLVSKSAHSQAYHPLGGLYAAPDTKVAWDAAFGHSRHGARNTATKAIDNLMRLMVQGSGTSMAVATLGSVGYFSRNIIGGSILLTAQSYKIWGSGHVGKSIRNAYAKAYGTNPADEQFLDETIALGIMGNGAQITYLREYLGRMRENPTGAAEYAKQVGLKVSPKMVELLGNGKTRVGKFIEFLGNTAEMTETWHNSALYEYELETLLKAGYGLQEARQEAAAKVMMVMPSKSEASQSVKAWTNHPIGALFGPFIRFKTDMIRTTVNTYRLAYREMGSDNDVIYARGLERFTAAFNVHAMFTILMPFLMRMAAGITPDEDKAVREAMPSYAKNSNFLMRKRGNNIETLDLTFSNPFSFPLDPFARSLTALLDQDPKEVPAIITRFATSEMLGENILAGSILDITRNVDESKGTPVWLDSDPFFDKITKGITHVASNSFTPNMLKKPYQAFQSSQRTDDKEQEFLFSPLGIMIGQALPTKVRTQTVDDIAFRAFRNISKSNQQLWQITSKFTSREFMAAGDEAELYKKRVAATRNNYALAHKVARAYESLGMNRNEVIGTMVRAGFSARRANLAYQGYAERPVISSEQLLKIREFDTSKAKRIEDAQRREAMLFDIR